MSFLSSKVVQSLTKEIHQLNKEPLDGISLQEVSDFSKISAIIEGPVETPFESSQFVITLDLSSEFPDKPPTGKFVTKIFHPNVSKSGEICVNTLKKDWKSTYGIKHILQVIRCLLIAPNPESALNEEAGRLFQEDYNEYFSKAKMLSSIHGKPKKKEEEIKKKEIKEEKEEKEETKEEAKEETKENSINNVILEKSPIKVVNPPKLDKKKSLKRL